MKRIVLLIVLLLNVTAHADELPTSPALQEQLREVERQFVRSGVPQDDAEATVRAMIQSRFTVEQVVRAGKQLGSDERRGIMGQALRNKIHEGLAKGISPESILSATERVRNRFASAAKLAAELDAPRDVSIVNTYADCLAAGLTEQHAHRLTSALKARAGVSGSSGRQSLAIETLLTTRAMVRRNISSATATGVMESALTRGYSGEEMRTLRQKLADSSLDLEETARRFGKAIDQGLRAGELQGLGGNSKGTGSDMGAGQGASGGSDGSSGSGSGGGGGSDGGSGGSGGGAGGSDGSGGGSGGNGGGNSGGSGGGHS